MSTAPPFLITIDTEGDDSWSRSSSVTTRNTAYLPRFQALAERYGLKPTWLTNYEMCEDDDFVEFARDLEHRDSAEVGMHLHAWHSPPEFTRTPDDYLHHPFLVEYPEEVMRDKIAFLTERIEERFGIRPTSHRAGRWVTDERYFRLLVEQGYTVDCSVTPGISWRTSRGAPDGRGGTDYTRANGAPHWVFSESEGLLQVPMTIVVKQEWLRRCLPTSLADSRGIRGRLKKLAPQLWLRPGYSEDLVAVAEMALESGARHLEFMLHSSELMPGGSPRFPDEASIETLYTETERLFAWAHRRCHGQTLSEFRDAFVGP